MFGSIRISYYRKMRTTSHLCAHALLQVFYVVLCFLCIRISYYISRALYLAGKSKWTTYMRAYFTSLFTFSFDVHESYFIWASCCFIWHGSMSAFHSVFPAISITLPLHSLRFAVTHLYNGNIVYHFNGLRQLTIMRIMWSMFIEKQTATSFSRCCEQENAFYMLFMLTHELTIAYVLVLVLVCVVYLSLPFRFFLYPFQYHTCRHSYIYVDRFFSLFSSLNLCAKSPTWNFVYCSFVSQCCLISFD